MRDILKCTVFFISKTIEQNKDKIVQLNDKKNQPKSNIYNCFIVKSQQLNHLHNSSPVDLSLTFNAGFNSLIYNALLITFIIIEDFKIVLPDMDMFLQ